MACASKGQPASALDKPGRSHGEMKTVEANVVMDESVKVLQQDAELGIALQLVQSFRVNPVGNQRRTNTVTRHVTNN
jgi:hypothetical protein